MGYIFWLVLTIIFIVIEFLIPTLVTIWFAVGAGITILISLIANNLNIEIVCFTVVSVMTLIFIRPYTKRIFDRKTEKFNSASLNSDIVIEKIISIDGIEKNYDVKYKGAIWTAVSNEIFKIGDKAKIKSFKGNKIIITKIEE